MDYEDVKALIEERKRKEAQQERQSKRKQQYQTILNEDVNALYHKLDRTRDLDTRYVDYRDKVTTAYVTEALTLLVDNCIDRTLIRNPYNQKLSRQLVSDFVKEEGASNLLRQFKSKSYMLSEIAYVCEEEIRSVLEKANPDNEETFKLEKKDKDDFYDKLSKTDVDETIDDIQNRVKKGTQEFIDNNIKEKAKLRNILDKTNDKVQDEKNKITKKQGMNDNSEDKATAMEESYYAEAKRKSVDLRESRAKNVFECMVRNLSKAAIMNENAKAIFMEDSKLNMDRIVEHCEVIYTFLTTMDSCKIINIDEQYIKHMLDDMKR